MNSGVSGNAKPKSQHSINHVRFAIVRVNVLLSIIKYYMRFYIVINIIYETDNLANYL